MSLNQESFIKHIQEGYNFSSPDIKLGAAIWEGNTYKEAKVAIPLKMMNRHGLIAGATGSGKTKTLQILAEQLSRNGVPVLVMDIKGDLSGIAAPGQLSEKIENRMKSIDIPFTTQGSPVEFLSLSHEPGTRVRATVTEFGPLLLSKILELNDTQQGIVALVFKWADDQGLPLLDLKDFKKTLQFLTNEGKQMIAEEYGTVSPASTGTIMRKILELEQQEAEIFFGEPTFMIDDLLRFDDSGKGIVSVLRLTDIQDRPKLFSTFMLQMLAEVYSTFPEVGDQDKPRFVIFIDEAHLIFNNASKALRTQIDTTIKLIRSKGVGVFFVTQSPNDIPESVLGQLGFKIQHVLRVFTAKDRKEILSVSQNFPLSNYYTTDQVLTSMGIGEALVTGLNEKGIPTPLVHTMLRAPESRMDILTTDEIKRIVEGSDIERKYRESIDRESAYEILAAKLESIRDEDNAQSQKGNQPTSNRRSDDKSLFEKILNNTTTRQILRTATREATRGIMNVLGLGGRSKRKSTWF